MAQPPPPVNPYAAPAPSSLAPSSNVVMETGGVVLPVVGLSRWIVGLFVALILAALALEWALVGQLGLLGRITSGETLAAGEAETNDMVVGLIALAKTTLLLPLAVVWIVWQRRCRLNLSALGVEFLRFSPGASIYWWFVPAANLFMPWQVMTEIWRASSAAADGEPDWGTRLLPGWLSAWWVAWVLRGVLGGAATQFEGPNANVLTTGTWVLMGATLASLAGAALAIVVVLKITDAQQRALERTRMA